MTNERAVEILKNEAACVRMADTCDRNCGKCDLVMPTDEILEAYDMAINALEREPCEDAVSRRKVAEYFTDLWETIGTIMDKGEWDDVCHTTANELPSVTPKPKVYCKECKHYEPSTWKEHSGWCNVEDDCEAGIEMTPDDYCSRGERR